MNVSTSNEIGLQKYRLFGIITEPPPGMPGTAAHHVGPFADVRHVREQAS
jgi:hypothetical protein